MTTHTDTIREECDRIDADYARHAEALSECRQLLERQAAEQAELQRQLDEAHARIRELEGDAEPTPEPEPGIRIIGLADGDIVAGPRVVTVEADEAITEVRFWWDDTTIDLQPDRIERTAPYSLGGDAGPDAVHPFDFPALGDGRHELLVEVTFGDYSIVTRRIAYTIATPQPEPEPEPGITPPADALRITSIRERIDTPRDVLVDGLTDATRVTKPLHGTGDNAAYFRDCHLTGRLYDGGVTEQFAVRFKRTFAEDCTFERVRRGHKGYGEFYNCIFRDLYEDFWQGGGIIRNCRVERVGWPIKDNSYHSDVIQAFGRMDVDGMHVETYFEQGINLARSASSGSVFRNVTITGDQGGGSGLLIEDQGGGGPSDVLFENVSIDKVVRIRGVNFGGDSTKNWKGKNLTFRNCDIPGLNDPRIQNDPRITVE